MEGTIRGPSLLIHASKLSTFHSTDSFMPRLGAIMKTATILATVILLATTMLAQAGVIFSDDFTRVPSNIVGNGWAETEFGGSDAQLIDTSVQLGNHAAVTQQISTLGLLSTQVEFDFADIIIGGAIDVLLSLNNAPTLRWHRSPRIREPSSMKCWPRPKPTIRRPSGFDSSNLAIPSAPPTR